MTKKELMLRTLAATLSGSIAAGSISLPAAAAETGNHAAEYAQAKEERDVASEKLEAARAALKEGQDAITEADRKAKEASAAGERAEKDLAGAEDAYERQHEAEKTALSEKEEVLADEKASADREYAESLSAVTEAEKKEAGAKTAYEEAPGTDEEALAAIAEEIRKAQEAFDRAEKDSADAGAAYEDALQKEETAAAALEEAKTAYMTAAGQEKEAAEEAVRQAEATLAAAQEAKKEAEADLSAKRSAEDAAREAFLALPEVPQEDLGAAALKKKEAQDAVSDARKEKEEAEKALKVAKAMYDITMESYGSLDADTEQARADLARAEQTLGEKQAAFEEAEKAMEQAYETYRTLASVSDREISFALSEKERFEGLAAEARARVEACEKDLAKAEKDAGEAEEALAGVLASGRETQAKAEQERCLAVLQEKEKALMAAQEELAGAQAAADAIGKLLEDAGGGNGFSEEEKSAILAARGAAAGDLEEKTKAFNEAETQAAGAEAEKEAAGNALRSADEAVSGAEVRKALKDQEIADADKAHDEGKDTRAAIRKAYEDAAADAESAADTLAKAEETYLAKTEAAAAKEEAYRSFDMSPATAAQGQKAVIDSQIAKNEASIQKYSGYAEEAEENIRTRQEAVDTCREDLEFLNGYLEQELADTEAVRAEIADKKAQIEAGEAAMEEEKASYEKTAETLKPYEEMYNLGTFRFYPWLEEHYPEFSSDIQSSLKLFETGTIRSYTHKGDPDDATSMGSIREAAKFMKELEQFRKDELGYTEPMYVTMLAMAGAQYDMNYAYVEDAHPKSEWGSHYAGQISANHAYSYTDGGPLDEGHPIGGWYYAERVLYEKARAAYGAELTYTDAVKYGYGHYWIVLKMTGLYGDYDKIGYACHLGKNAFGDGVAHLCNACRFSSITEKNTYISQGRAITVDRFAELVDEYLADTGYLKAEKPVLEAKAAYEALCEEKKEEAIALNTEIRRLESDVQSRENRIANQTRPMIRLKEADLAKAQENLEKAIASRDKYLGAVTRLEDSNTSLRAEKEACEETIRTVTEQKNALQDEMRAAAAEKSQAEEAAAKALLAKQKADRASEDTKAQLEKMEQEESAFRTSMALLQKEAETLAAELTEAREKQQAAAEAYKVAEENAETAAKALSAAEDAVEKAGEALEEAEKLCALAEKDDALKAAEAKAAEAAEKAGSAAAEKEAAEEAFRNAGEAAGAATAERESAEEAARSASEAEAAAGQALEDAKAAEAAQGSRLAAASAAYEDLLVAREAKLLAWQDYKEAEDAYAAAKREYDVAKDRHSVIAATLEYYEETILQREQEAGAYTKEIKDAEARLNAADAAKAEADETLRQAEDEYEALTKAQAEKEKAEATLSGLMREVSAAEAAYGEAAQAETAALNALAEAMARAEKDPDRILAELLSDPGKLDSLMSREDPLYNDAADILEKLADAMKTREDASELLRRAEEAAKAESSARETLSEKQALLEDAKEGQMTAEAERERRRAVWEQAAADMKAAREAADDAKALAEEAGKAYADAQAETRRLQALTAERVMIMSPEAADTALAGYPALKEALLALGAAQEKKAAADREAKEAAEEYSGCVARVKELEKSVTDAWTIWNAAENGVWTYLDEDVTVSYAGEGQAWIRTETGPAFISNGESYCLESVAIDGDILPEDTYTTAGYDDMTITVDAAALTGYEEGWHSLALYFAEDREAGVSFYIAEPEEIPVDPTDPSEPGEGPEGPDTPAGPEEPGKDPEEPGGPENPGSGDTDPEKPTDPETGDPGTEDPGKGDTDPKDPDTGNTDPEDPKEPEAPAKEDVSDIFKDVRTGSWYHDYVQYVYDHGIMTGMSKDTFAPGSTLCRAQFATVIWRMEGSPKVSYEKKFKDVREGAWYADAVMWASKAGIITGYTSGAKAGYFGPSDPASREQMVTMMYRYAKYRQMDTTKTASYTSFTDAKKVSSYASDAMKWAVGTGIISGKENGTRLDPHGETSRAETATIIQRFLR